jgi:hypothetical protein
MAIEAIPENAISLTAPNQCVKQDALPAGKRGVTCSDQALEIHVISRGHASVRPGQILIRRQARFRTSFHMIAEPPQWSLRQVPNLGRAGRAALWTHGSTEASGPAVVPLRRVADLNEPAGCTTRRGARQEHEVGDGLPAVRHRASGSPCCGRLGPYRNSRNRSSSRRTSSSFAIRAARRTGTDNLRGGDPDKSVVAICLEYGGVPLVTGCPP